MEAKIKQSNVGVFLRNLLHIKKKLNNSLIRMQWKEKSLDCKILEASVTIVNCWGLVLHICIHLKSFVKIQPELEVREIGIKAI